MTAGGRQDTTANTTRGRESREALPSQDKGKRARLLRHQSKPGTARQQGTRQGQRHQNRQGTDSNFGHPHPCEPLCMDPARCRPFRAHETPVRACLLPFLCLYAPLAHPSICSSIHSSITLAPPSFLTLTRLLASVPASDPPDHLPHLPCSLYSQFQERHDQSAGILSLRLPPAGYPAACSFAASFLGIFLLDKRPSRKPSGT